MKKISIITATYNSESTLRACLDSVASQQAIAQIEHIIVDGRSSDSTLAIVAEYPHVSKVMSQHDRGIYHAFNNGLNLANGDIIYFLNSDDELLDSSVVSDVLTAFNQDIDFYCGVVLFVNSRDGRDFFSTTYKSDSINFKPRHQAFFCRRGLFDKLGPFNECLNIAADTYFMKNAIKSSKGVFTDRGIARFSLGGFSCDEKNKINVITQDAIVDNLLSINSLYSDMAERFNLAMKNVDSIKILFLKSLNGQINLTALQGLKVGIFGTRELSQILALILKQQNIELKCFVVSKCGELETVMNTPVISIDSLKLSNLDILINCVEGAHECIIRELVLSEDENVEVLSWRQVCDSAT